MAAISTGADSCGTFPGCEKEVLPILCGLATAAIARALGHAPTGTLLVRAGSSGRR